MLREVDIYYDWKKVTNNYFHISDSMDRVLAIMYAYL